MIMSDPATIASGPDRFGLARFGLAPLNAVPDRAAARAVLLADLERTGGVARGAASLPSTRDALTAMAAKRSIARASKATMLEGKAPLEAAELAELKAAGDHISMEAELRAAIRAARDQPVGYAERLALHWTNHFTVSSGKGKVRWSIGPYAREVVRPHLTARFENMLLAAITHPAMLYYLDNAGSIGAGSIVGARKSRGLNENLAREVLELHTLGVDGGYGQADVVALAKILSGWSVDIRLGSPTCGTTIFDPRRHEPGSKTLLGRTFTDAGRDELIEAVKFLAAHPATARNVSRRLVGNFLSDAPPAAAVDAVARRFRETGGDLGQTARALVDIDAMWTTPPQKLRPPIELLYIADRLLGGFPAPPKLVTAMQAMGQPYLSAPSPKGWAEEDDAWLSSDGIKSRLDWAAEVGTNNADRFPETAFAQAAANGMLSRDTIAAIRGAETREQGVALLLMSPEIQRR